MQALCRGSEWWSGAAIENGGLARPGGRCFALASSRRPTRRDYNHLQNGEVMLGGHGCPGI